MHAVRGFGETNISASHVVNETQTRDAEHFDSFLQLKEFINTTLEMFRVFYYFI
jgi:hypothetical protein